MSLNKSLFPSLLEHCVRLWSLHLERHIAGLEKGIFKEGQQGWWGWKYLVCASLGGKKQEETWRNAQDNAWGGEKGLGHSLCFSSYDMPEIDDCCWANLWKQGLQGWILRTSLPSSPSLSLPLPSPLPWSAFCWTGNQTTCLPSYPGSTANSREGTGRWVGFVQPSSPATAYLKAGWVSHDVPSQLLQNRDNIFSQYKIPKLAVSQKTNQAWEHLLLSASRLWIARTLCLTPKREYPSEEPIFQLHSLRALYH